MDATHELGARFESYHDITLDSIVRYAGASGDFTPIHWDAEHAREAGYDNFFAMGMLPAGWLSALLVQSFGPGTVRSFSVRFRNRSWLGLGVRCTAEVRELGPESGQLLLAIAAVGPGGEVLVDGTAIVVRA